MESEVDIDAYFARVGYGGETTPTLETLSGLIEAHITAIPFENLDVLLRSPILLDLPSVERKLVVAKRGGYCFEHGTLFAAVLSKLGFAIDFHTARVTLFMPRSESPRTHMLLSVMLPEGQFIADPGFGGLAPRIPLRVPEGESGDDGATHRLVRDGRFFVMRGTSGEKTVDAWSSTLEPENPIDYILGNHFTSSFPDSPMVNRLMLRAFSGDSMLSVMNRDVTIQTAGHTKQYQLADRKELRTLLNEHFGFDLPEVETICIPSVPEWE